ncbi:MAG: class III signal peptide-containing protein [Candidatus Micrarchaeota archaeon]
MNIPTKKKGQGAFEYILLLAGILLIVVLVIVILKGGLLTETQTNVRESAGTSQANARTNCLNWCGTGAWRYMGDNNAANASCVDYGSTGLLGSSPNANCFYPTCSNATYAGIAPQNARACGLFSTDVPA